MAGVCWLALALVLPECEVTELPAGHRPPNRIVSGGLAPVLGAVREDERGGVKHVGHGNDRPARDTEGFRHGDGGGDKSQFGLPRSVRPGVPVPVTVLVAVMTDNGYLVGYPLAEPAAFIAVDDAHQMQKVPITAFGLLGKTPTSGNNSRLRVARDRL